MSTSGKTIAVIFSFNRAMQLDATVRSYLAMCDDPGLTELRVLYKYTDAANQRQYEELMREYAHIPFVRFVGENDFLKDLLLLVAPHEYVLFLVDDNIFVKPFSFKKVLQQLNVHRDAIGFSLRLGVNTDFCYPLDTAQRLPEFQKTDDGILLFDWTNAEHDFHYPLELSSSVYRTNEIMPLLASLPFKNPNTLEAMMHGRVADFTNSHPRLLCYETSRTFCAPLNKVQTVAGANRASQEAEYTPENLARLFEKGYRIDTRIFENFTPNACHQEVELTFFKKEHPFKNSKNELFKNGDEAFLKAGTPLVSVVIPCYGQAHFLKEAVESVVGQSFKSWEIIIVNDGSPDNTDAAAQELIQQYSQYSIRLLKKDNGGLSDARNAGIEAARGHYILPLDADDRIHPEYLSEAVQILDAHPEYHIVYTDEQNFGDKTHVHRKGPSRLETLAAQNIHDYCCLYRREVWEKSGGYSPAMYLGGEDWNFWLGAAENGFVSYHLPKPYFFYRNRANSMVAETNANMNEVSAHIVLHHPALYPQQLQRQAEEIMSEIPDKNKAKLSSVFKKHPENALLKKFALLAGLSHDTFKNNRPLVSVIIPTYNRPAMLREAVGSVLAQDYKNIEIIIVNDAGEDISALVQEFRQKGNIRLVTHTRNQYLAAARNTGLRESRGELIAYLDDDDIYYPDHISTLAAEFLKDENLVVAYTDSYCAHQQPDEYSPTGYSVFKKELVYSREFDRDTLLVSNYIPVCCIMHRRDMTGITGGFDELLKAHEDHDLWVRASRLFAFQHIRHVTCEYRQRSDASNMTTASAENFFKALFRIYTKYRFITDSLPHIRQRQNAELFAFYTRFKNSRGEQAHPEDLAADAPRIEIPSFTVFIPAHDFAEQTVRSVESVLHAQKDFPVEIVVLVSSGPDAFLKLAELHPQVRIVGDSEESFQQAVAVARGGHHILMERGEEMARGWFEEFLKDGQEDSRVAHSKPDVRPGHSFKTSIIIPVFNQLHYTKQCLETLFKNTPQDRNFEVIVVDNASTDGTEEFFKTAVSIYPYLRYIRNSENEFFAKACNRGARESQGKVLVFLNNDTEVEPGWLDAPLKDLENPEIGIVGIKLLYPDRTIQHAGISFFKNTSSGRYVWPDHRFRHAAEDDPRVNVREDVDVVTGACIFLQRDFFFGIGAFTDDYGMYFEDTDLCFKVRRAGRRVLYEPASVVIHHEAKSSPTQNEAHRKNEAAGKIFYKRWSAEIAEIALKPFTVRTEGKFIFLDGSIWPKELENGAFAQENILEFSILLQTLPEFYLHFGGIGDALMLMASFYDRQPESAILAMSNSPAAAQAFYSAFPKLTKIYVLPPAPGYVYGLILRTLVSQLKNCLGMGITPPSRYEDTWKPGINIFKSPYNVVKYPQWAQSFKKEKLQPFQVVLAPKGSVYGTFRSKRNTLDPKFWQPMLEFLKANNIRPVVIGTPDENTAYPLDENCIDRRSYSFKDQMEVIASADLFIGADSWGKTFSAMANVPTIVFKAMGGHDLAYWQDNSDFVFIRPWENIAHVENFAGFLKTCAEVFKSRGLNVIIPENDTFLKTVNTKKLLPHGQQVTSFDPVFWTRDYKSFKNILVRVTPAVGDALMLTAVVRSLKTEFPEKNIYISGDERAEWIFKNNPHIAGIIQRNSNEELRLEADAEVIEYNHLIDRLPEYYNGLHYMDILGNIAGVKLDNYELDYTIENDEKHRAAELLKSFKKSGEMLVGVQLTTNKDMERSYIAPDFLPQLCKEFPHAKFILFGQETPGFTNSNLFDCAAEKIPFRDQVALAAHCDTFITIDSAFYHVAHNLFKKTTLLIAGPTNEALIGNPVLGLTFPVRNFKNGCFPCYWQKSECRKDCLKNLAAGDVIKAFKEMLLKVRNGEFPLWTPTLETVEINAVKGEDYHQEIAQALFKKAATIIIKNIENLPAYAANWNGITVPHFPGQPMKSLQSPFRLKNAGGPAVVKPDADEQASFKNEQKLPQINLVWEGSQFVNHSLALINREHAANVIKSGVAEVTVVPYEPDQFAPGNAKEELLKEHDVRFKKPAPENISKLPYAWIRHQWPPKAEPPRGAKWIIMQPWEYSSVPKDFIEILKNADEVWTPSNFSRSAFVNAGLDSDKVQIVPNGINPDVFTPSGDPVDFPVDKRLKFLFVGGTIFRKGIDVLLKAYTQAFTAADDVCLIIKDMGGDSFYKGQTAKELIEQIKRDPNAPEIRYTDAILPETQLAELYRACDVFVSPYRGEGFSLPALEAMACGLPVIVTEGGATDDFADENTGWKIPATPRAIGRSFDGREMVDEAFVLEPDAEYLAELLKDIYDNPQEITVKGIAASLRSRSEWTWNRATLKMLSRLDYLYQATMSRDAGGVLKDTDDGNILIGRAEDLYHRGDVDGAIEHYTNAFKAGGLTKKYILHALHRMASIALADNDTELANDFIFKADEIYAGHVDTIYLHSLCLGLQENWVEAQEQLTEILNHWKEVRFDTTLGLTLDMILCDTARALLSTGAVEEAHEIYTEALKINPESADACYGAAQCFKSFGEHAEARQMLEWAVRLRPDFTLAVEELDITRD